MKYRLRTINAALAVILLFSALGFMPRTVEAGTPTELFFSEYIEGSSYSKALEIYNGTGAAVDLAAGAYNIQMYFNGNVAATLTINLTGTVADGDVFVVAGSNATTPADPAILAQADLVSFDSFFNGDDAVVLRKGTDIIDVIGQIGYDPGSQWGVDLVSTADNTLRRKDTVCQGDPNGSDVFDPALEWDGYELNTFDGLGTHTANCGGTELPIIRINELDSDTPDSTDLLEFVELYDGGFGNTPLDGLVLVFYNGNVDLSYAAYDLDTYSTDANGYFLIGNSGVIPTPSLTFANGFLQNGQDAVALYTGDATSFPNGTAIILENLIDAIVYDTDDADDPGLLPLLNAGQPQVNEAGALNKDIHSNQRCPNGSGGLRNTDTYVQRTPTPGGENYCPLDDAPSVASTVPANGEAGVAVDADIVVTFSEQVTVAPGWYTISCDISGTHTAVVTGGDTVYSLNPDTDFVAAESCTVTIAAATVTDLDIIDPPDNMAADYSFTFRTPFCGEEYTKINVIQGSGLTSPFVGQTKTVEGVVTAYLPGMSGSYLESVPNDKDADETTSEGIFVYQLNKDPGDIVRVTGLVSDFTSTSFGNVASMTQLSSITNVEVCNGIGVAPTPITLPIPSDADPNAYLERYEGMLVSFDQPLTVQQNYFQGRFGQLTLGSDGRIMNPTNGTGGDYTDNIGRMIVLDDGSTVQNPNPISYYPNDGALRAGDTISGLVGVIDQGWINTKTSGEPLFPNAYYRIHPVVPPILAITNPRPQDSPEQAGNISIASFNVLNYFTTLDIKPYPIDSPYTSDNTPRGADSATELTRQQDKLVAAALDIDADILGLNEIEAWDGAYAVEAFTNALNTALGETVYAYIPDPAGGVGGDAIQQAIIYKPASVSPVGAALSLSATPFDLYRYPIAQLFADNASGEQFWVVVNHFKSKNCGDPNYTGDEDLGGGIGCYNATRVAMSEALLTWIDESLSVLDPDVIVTGDLNSYGGEDPIMTLTDAGMVDQVAQHLDPLDRYTYVFDGMAGYLDHAITTPSLAEYVADAAIWHINTDEPSVIDYNLEFKNPDLYQSHEFRSSDHDPVIITLRFSEFIYYFPLIFN